MRFSFARVPSSRRATAEGNEYGTMSTASKGAFPLLLLSRRANVSSAGCWALAKSEVMPHSDRRRPSSNGPDEARP